MNIFNQYMVSKDTGTLQLPYGEYVELLERLEDAQRVLRVRKQVLEDLRNSLARLGSENLELELPGPKNKKLAAGAEKQAPVAAKAKSEPAAKSAVSASGSSAAAAARPKETSEVPPIKKEIASHFNSQDASGRLFNVFKQYYTIINEMCGGTIRVTLKDGVCSLWNYDAWEEFGYVDIFEGELRFAIDLRFTDKLSSLNVCEVPRLLSSRKNLICVKVGDLNNTMLDVLALAFKSVGITKS